MKIITTEEFARAVKLDKLKVPGLAPLLMELMKINRLNEFYAEHEQHKDAEFLEAVLQGLGVSIDISERDRENIPVQGAFIAIANHPYGGIEGLMLLQLLCSKRPDSKVMANFILKKIPNLSDYFIAVNPFENVNNVSSLSGMKESLNTLSSGRPLGIFPAGEVSTYKTATQTITDKEWSPIVGKLICKAAVPVVPIYFHGNNGVLFNMLSLLHPALRTARLPSELFNKKGHVVKIRIGKAIPAKELSHFESPEECLNFLRAKTYALGSGLEVKRFFSRDLFKVKKEPEIIIDPTPTSLLMKDIEEIRDNALIYTEKDYEVFIAKTRQIPHVMREIGRLREITFRDVGEGTNKKTDIDRFDLYYHHLFIWHKLDQKLVGAYRIGRGKPILYAYGQKGFYINTLFKIDEQFNAILKQCIELGRSFIVKEYQQKSLPLFLLWKGILAYLVQNPEIRYMIGPVSISNNFSSLSKSLMVAFIKEHFYDHKLSEMVHPRKEFSIKKLNIDPNMLLGNKTSIKDLDAVISDIEINKLKVPVLLRQYIMQLNARIIGFNTDPKFGDCLDGFLMVDVNEIPPEQLEMLKKRRE